MTGFRFALALREPGTAHLVTEMVELDGIPAIWHRLRVRATEGEVDFWIVGITWFHAPGALSLSGELLLSGHQP